MHQRVFKQTFTNFEHIIIDGGSNNKINIIKKFKEN